MTVLYWFMSALFIVFLLVMALAPLFLDRERGPRRQD